MHKILLVGAGGIGNRHIRGFLKTGRAQLSIVEPDPVKREFAEREYKITESYSSLEDAKLSSHAAAVIATPAHLHIPMATTCAKAGLHLLVEKPLSTSMLGVKRLESLVARKKLTVRIGYVFRTAPELQEMRRQIQAGRIGEPKMAYINTSQDFPKYRPDFQKTYYASPEKGGGTILDAASHMIDVIQWLLGPIAEVSAMYDRLALPGVNVEDSCLISLRLKSGGMAQININQFQKPNTRTIEMIGTKGNLLIEHANLKFADNDSGNWETQKFADNLTPMEMHEARFRLQADQFLDAVEGKPSLLATLANARENLQVALAAKKSYLTHKIIKLK